MKKIFAFLFPTLTNSFAPFGAGKLTVDGALAQFNKVVADLKKVKAAQDAEEQKQAQAAVDAEAKREDTIRKATEDAEKAIAAANNAEMAAANEARRAAIAIAKIEAFIA